MQKASFQRLMIGLVAGAGLATGVGAFEFRLTVQPEAIAPALQAASATAPLVDNNEAAPIDIMAAARSDYLRLLRVLYDQGYYGASIRIRVDGREVSGISLLRAEQAVKTVQIDVDAGVKFSFAKAEIGPIPAGTKTTDGFAMGQPAKASAIRDAAQAAISDWRDAGHAKADVTSQSITANHPQSQLSVDIGIAPGPRLRFGALKVPQGGTVRADRIQDIAGLPTGQVFSPQELDTVGQRLRRSGAFRSVVLSEAETANRDQTLDIDAELVDAKPRRIGFGAEIGTLEGLSLSGFWLHRNLLGGAERLRFDAEVSGITSDVAGIDYSIGARFDRPATFTPDTAIYVETRLARVVEPDYREDSARLETGLTHIFNDRLSGEIAIGLQYSDVSDALGDRTLSYLQLPVGLTYDTRDNELNATTGVYIDVDLMPFYESRGAASGARFYSDLRTYVTPGLFDGALDQITAALRLQAGSVVGGSTSDIAPEMLFFSGGAGTVRGQGYQSLAVDLGGGLTTGGRSFIGASAELRAQVTDTWSVVAFYDAGFIGENSFASSDGDWHYGAGFGVRYNTGIGPIRLDVATPVGAGSGNNVEFYIGIGQAF